MSVLLWLAAAASSGAIAQAPEAAPVMAVEDKIVCKSERFVGSHLSQRICKPKSEWETAKKSAKDGLQKMWMVRPGERDDSRTADPGPPSRIPR